MEFCMLRTKKTRLSGEHTRDETMSYFHFATTSRCYFVNYHDINVNETNSGAIRYLYFTTVSEGPPLLRALIFKGWRAVIARGLEASLVLGLGL